MYDELSAQKAGRINRSGAQHGGAGSANARPAARYVGQLKQAAAVREIEQDRIYERVQLKERQKDDALYGDKEKFVTGAYKRKLQEAKKWDEEDKRLEAVEAATSAPAAGMASHARS